MTESPINDKPPFFKNWTNLYWAVILNLVMLIAMMFAFTQIFQ